MYLYKKDTIKFQRDFCSSAVQRPNYMLLKTDKCPFFQEGTQALREMLQIGGEKPADNQGKVEPSSRGRQLSLDELFRSQREYSLEWRTLASLPTCQSIELLQTV